MKTTTHISSTPLIIKSVTKGNCLYTIMDLIKSDNGNERKQITVLDMTNKDKPEVVSSLIVEKTDSGVVISTAGNDHISNSNPLEKICSF